MIWLLLLFLGLVASAAAGGNMHRSHRPIVTGVGAGFGVAAGVVFSLIGILFGFCLALTRLDRPRW